MQQPFFLLNQSVITGGGGCELLPGVSTTGLQFNHVGPCLTGNDGDTIALWPDSSAAANDLVHGDVNSRPKVKLAGLNSLAVARYGTNILPSLMTFDVGLSLSTFAYFAVMKYTKNTAADPATLVGCTSNGGPQVRIWQNKISLVKQAVVEIGQSATTLSSGTWYTIGVTYDGTTATFYLNGTSDGTASNAQTFTADMNMQGKGPDQNFEGDIAEDICWNVVPSGGDLTAAMNALQTRWAHY